VSNYYNENNPYAAQWLRNLIAAGHIAPGDVDERSILDVSPDDLAGYVQCHFFAGIGVWSYALRRAGWPDDRSVWTGSCPCQPFSVAGMGLGFDDERHLWPFWHYLIEQRRPSIVLGEQVASKDADPWIDLVQDDMEALGYAFGAIPFPSAGVGAPHIRDRLYWVADAGGVGRQRRSDTSRSSRQSEAERREGVPDTERSGVPRRVGDAGSAGLAQRFGFSGISGSAPRAEPREAIVRAGIHTGGLANAATTRSAELGRGWIEPSGLAQGSEPNDAGASNGFWRDADWLFCRDGKWRPVEPGTFPLAHGASSRVGRLRAYGNAINAEAACAFIETVMECQP
jgi:DNA (cytosine-5)-methyltransferase 1